MKIRKHVFSGGAHTPHRKHTALSETVAFTTPSVVLLPMQQHIGAPCQPVVKTGEQVKVGQLVADSEQAFSAPIYASVSGTVGKIKRIEMPSGQQVEAIEIIPDGLMEADEQIAPP